MGMKYLKPEVKSYSISDIIEEIGPCQNQYTTTTFYTSTAATGVNLDGNAWSNNDDDLVDDAGLYIGDDIPENYSRAFLGFDISSIAGRTIVSATLRVYQEQHNGDPYSTLSGRVLVDHVNFGSTYGAGDFAGNTLTTNIGTISNNSTFERKTLDVSTYVQADLTAGRTSSQFRLYFSWDQGIPDDAEVDSIEFDDAEGSGGTANRPELVVTYR